MFQPRRKSYFVLLAVAALGLVIDRFVLTESATAPARASGQGSVRSGDGKPVPTKTTAHSASIPEIPFPLGLRTAEASMPILDLFAPPSVRMHGESGTGQPYNAATGSGGPRRSERLGGTAFERRHTLDGVMVLERLRMAVVDGRPVRMGDTIDGCTLQDVSGYRARFECHDGPAVLIVKDTGTRVPG